MVTGKLFDLFGLFAYGLLGIGEMMINELLVGLVNERGEEQDGGRNKCKAPQWNDLDQVVGEESADKCLDSCQTHQRSDHSGRTAAVADKFSAKRMRWASIKKKLTSS